MKCTIVVSGPSLDFRYLNRIRNEFSFSAGAIGSIYHLTHWRPTVYVVASRNAALHQGEFLRAAQDAKIVYVNKDYTGMMWKAYMPLVMHDYPDTCEWKPEWWSDEPMEWVSKYGTSLLPCVQLAFWMGFREITFAGCDGYDPKRERQHVDGYPDWAEEFDVEKFAPILEAAHKLIAYHARRRGVKVRFAGRYASPFEKIYDR